MPFQKGKSGNPGGKGKDKAFADAVRVAVNRVHDGDPEGRKKLTVLADRLVDWALAGEGWAYAQIADRLDGKPAQESTVNVVRRIEELTDQEIATRIAELRGAGASGGDTAAPVDPSQLN